MTVSWSVEENASVRLVLERPDGEVVLRDNFAAQANQVYTETGNAGSLVGLRTTRERPWLEPRACAGVKRSSPSTRLPRRARWYAAALPIAPRPTTIAS